MLNINEKVFLNIERARYAYKAIKNVLAGQAITHILYYVVPHNLL